MGRPLKKKYFGNPDEKEGKQILLTEAWIPNVEQKSEENTVYIVKQISKVRFVVSDGTNEGIVNLQEEPITAEGQARIIIKPCTGLDDYKVTVDIGIPSTMEPNAEESSFQINNRTVKSFEGNNFRWFEEDVDCHNGDAKMPLFDAIPTTPPTP